jgi:hypothetical protein
MSPKENIAFLSNMYVFSYKNLIFFEQVMKRDVFRAEFRAVFEDFFFHI